MSFNKNTNVQNLEKSIWISVPIKFYNFSQASVLLFKNIYCSCSIFNIIILKLKEMRNEQPAAASAKEDNNDPCALTSSLLVLLDRLLR